MSAHGLGVLARADLTFGAAGALASLSVLLGVVAIAVGIVRAPTVGRDAAAELSAALGLGLDLFLAAGLLRLSRIEDLRALAAVALVIALRKLTSRGVGLAVRALGSRPPGRLRA